MRRSRSDLAIYIFFAILVGVMLGYTWRCYHERLDARIKAKTSVEIPTSYSPIDFDDYMPEHLSKITDWQNRYNK